jgi:16S rRNA pseudouridine516 synthase
MKKAIKKILQSQGFGTGKEVTLMIHKGKVSVHNVAIKNPKQEFETQGLEFEVEGIVYPFYEKIYLMMNKALGDECSRKATHNRSVFDRLPEQFVVRGVQNIGRLDAESTGQLLFSDDGQFNHHITSPRRNLHKRYRVQTADPLSDKQRLELLDGVMLNDEPTELKALEIHSIGDTEFDIIIGEGRYHQIRRMLGAVGNRVTTLHRVSVGNLSLDNDLTPGDWRLLTLSDLEILGFKQI